MEVSELMLVWMRQGLGCITFCLRRDIGWQKAMKYTLRNSLLFELWLGGYSDCYQLYILDHSHSKVGIGQSLIPNQTWSESKFRRVTLNLTPEIDLLESVKWLVNHSQHWPTSPSPWSWPTWQRLLRAPINRRLTLVLRMGLSYQSRSLTEGEGPFYS